MERYSHSGTVTASGLLLMPLAGLVTAGVLAVVYSVIIVHVPFIYANFLATAAFGFATGYTIGRAAKIGKIRNPLVAGLFGLVFGLVGLYIAWAADFIIRFELPQDDYLVAFRPGMLSEYIAVFYDQGFWGFSEKSNVSGLLLAAIWLVEAGVIVGLAMLTAHAATAKLTFCERCQTWNQVVEDVRRLAIGPGQESVIERLATGNLSALKDLTVASPETSVYLRVDMAQCQTCSDSSYVTVQLVTETVDKDGDVSTDTDALLTNVLVTEAELIELQEAGQPAPEGEPDVGTTMEQLDQGPTDDPRFEG